MAGYRLFFPKGPQTSYMLDAREPLQNYSTRTYLDTAECRKFFLYRSVFDLVASYPYLEKDDQELLAWYLHLSPQDRQIILEQGGFQLFLQRHPALVLTGPYVFVKKGMSLPVNGSMRSKVAAATGNTFQIAHNRLVEVKPVHEKQQMTLIQEVPHKVLSTDVCDHLYHLADPSLGIDLDTKSGLRSDLTHLEPDYHSFDDIKLGIERLIEFEEPTRTKRVCDHGSGSLEDAPAGVTVQRRILDKCCVSSSDQLRGEVKMFTRGTSTVSNCHLMTGTQHPDFVSSSTQTEAPTAADKNVITEVHMSDLDCVLEQFVKMKAALESQRKEEKTNGDELYDRARHAELCVLALQHSMCRQYCWRIFNLSGEGESFFLSPGTSKPYWPQATPTNVVSVLEKLDSDYHKMREQILAGVPLKDLRSLSVDATMVTGTSYSPLPTYQMIGDPLFSSQLISQQSNEKETFKENQIHRSSSNEEAEMKLSPENETISNPSLPRETSQNDVETNMMEKWFDAMEGFSSLSGDEQSNHKNMDSDTEELDSNLPLHLTEPAEGAVNLCQSDVTFEEHGAPDVKISAFENSRVLVKTVVVLSDSDSSQDAFDQQTETVCDDMKPHGSMMIMKTTTSQNLLIPTHMGTKESLDVLMVELKQQHPSVSRQRFTDALRELHIKHSVIGLPIQTVGQMISDHLSRPANMAAS